MVPLQRRHEANSGPGGIAAGSFEAANGLPVEPVLSAPERSVARSVRVPSFDEIYDAWFDEVAKWIRAMGGPEADRDDLVQDVFVTVHRRLCEFDGRNLAGWLYRITRRKVRDFRRLRWYRLFLGRAPVPEELASVTRGPEKDFSDKEDQAILLRLLDKLPEAQRSAFVLFEIEGCSGEEIAQLCGAPINTVWARIRKARMKLVKELARLPQCRDGRAR